MSMERVMHLFEDDRAALTILETIAADVGASAQEPVQLIMSRKSIKLTGAQVVDLRDTLNTIINRQYGMADRIVRDTHTEEIR